MRDRGYGKGPENNSEGVGWFLVVAFMCAAAFFWVMSDSAPQPDVPGINEADNLLGPSQPLQR